MFGLPLETALVVIGVPLAWIVYTAVFLYVSRGWRDEEDDA